MKLAVKISFLAFLFLGLFQVQGYSQIAAWNLTAGNTTAATTVNANATASALTCTAGAFAWGAAPGEVETTNWRTLGTFSAAGPYWQISITPNATYTLNVTSVTFDAGVYSASGPQTLDVQYSLNGFGTAGTTCLAGWSNTNSTGTSLTTATLTSVPASTTNTITFRIYGYNAGSTVGNFKINNLVINGTVTAGPACTCTLPFTETFESAWSVPSTLINQTCAWSSAIGAGGDANNQWQQESYTTNWTSPTSGAWFPTYTNGGANTPNHSARFHNYYAPNATTGDLITPLINFSTVGAKTLSFQYTNEDNSTLTVYLSTNGGATWSLVSTQNTPTTGWVAVSNIALGVSTNTNCQLKFTATSNYGSYDMGIDDISVTCPVAGPPTVNSTAMTFPAKDCQSVSLSWTAGNGSNRIVVAHAVSAVTGSPASNTTYTANTAIGSGTACGNGTVVYNGNGSSVTVTGLTTGTTYYFEVFEYNGSAGSELYLTSGGPLTGNQAPAAAATAPTTQSTALSFSSITCNSMVLTWTKGNGTNRIVVAKSGSAVAGNPVNQSAYTANASFSSGSAIAAGEYIVYSGSGNTVTVTSLTASTTYYFKIYEDNGSSGCEVYLTGGGPLTGNAPTISCVSVIPYMTGGVINACNGSCGSEGSNEILFFTSGSYSIPVNPANIILTYGSNPAPTVIYTGSFTTDAAETATLNAQAAACNTPSNVFIDAMAAGTIPANSTFILVNDAYCNSYDMTAFCGSYGKLYVVYVTDPRWVNGTTAGNFANSGTLRYFRTDFSGATGGGTTGLTDYSYSPNAMFCGCDGDAVDWTSAGGGASYVTPSSCTLGLAVLPIELIAFSGKRQLQDVELDWSTATETNNAYFTLERSGSDGEFSPIGTFAGAGNSSRVNNYHHLDKGAPSGQCYYRLKQTDFNGQYKYASIVSVKPGTDFKLEEVFPNPATDKLQVTISQESLNEFELSVEDILGKCVYKTTARASALVNTFAIPLTELPAGIYVVKVAGPQQTFQKKFIKR
jgi:2-keto-4-pentenoate hydratase